MQILPLSRGAAPAPARAVKRVWVAMGAHISEAKLLGTVNGPLLCRRSKAIVISARPRPNPPKARGAKMRQMWGASEDKTAGGGNEDAATAGGSGATRFASPPSPGQVGLYPLRRAPATAIPAAEAKLEDLPKVLVVAHERHEVAHRQIDHVSHGNVAVNLKNAPHPQRNASKSQMGVQTPSV